MKAKQTIYLDHAATTPLHEEVWTTMEPYFREFYGNPSSIHRVGRRANVALESARRTIADLIHASPKELIFTSGGTEGEGRQGSRGTQGLTGKGFWQAGDS